MINNENIIDPPSSEKSYDPGDNTQPGGSEDSSDEDRDPDEEYVERIVIAMA